MEPFIGEIKMFAGNFAPRGYAFCDGQLLSIAQNDALFSLLGTMYGGDGMTVFGLPDLRGRVPVHVGQGPGLSPRQQAQKGGAERVTLTDQQLPSHGHGSLKATPDQANTTLPAGNAPATSLADLYSMHSPFIPMSPEAVSHVGGGQAHENMFPFQAISFIIALTGIYPSRS